MWTATRWKGANLLSEQSCVSTPEEGTELRHLTDAALLERVGDPETMGAALQEILFRVAVDEGRHDA